MPSREEVDTKDRADRALRAGRPREALPLYKSLLTKVSHFEPGLYDGWVEGASAAYRNLGQRREAAYTLMALQRYAEAERLLDPVRRPVEWALCVSRQGRGATAADHLAAQGFPVLAAHERERSGDLPGARALWEKLLTTSRLRARPYETALVRVTLARIARAQLDHEGADDHAVEALRLLEGLADGFETSGLRERAFDCHTLILRLGKESGSFENICEGYANAIRLLAIGASLHEPLQYGDDFIALACERGEWSAAATAAMEAAEHSRRMGLAFERHYLARAVTLWTESARHALSSGLAVEVAENGLSAALDAAASLGDLPLLGRTYQLLSELPLPDARRARYRDLASRYQHAGESPAPGPGLPEHLLAPNPYPDIGIQDLIEWELDGDPLATLAMVLVERRDSVRYKRLALRAMLAAPGEVNPFEDPAAASELALALGSVQIYEVLRPLERLYAGAPPSVRSAVMTGVGQVLNKRSFLLLRLGLADDDEAVREEARRALRGLHFAEGLDSLVRIYREHKDQVVRETVVAAASRIGTLEAGLFLLDVIRDDNDHLRALAADRLGGFPAADLLPHVRGQLDLAVGPARQFLRHVARALEALPT